jgi:hypothetical protein
VQQGARSVRGVDGRAVVAAVVMAYLAAVAIARLGFDLDLWPWIGVPSHELAFVDALNVASAAECHRLGHDVLVDNPCDPLLRPMNYPRVWLLFAYLGMDLTWVVPFGLAIVGGFLLSAWALLGRLSVRQGVPVAAAVCSPAVMFAVERGQVDLVVFALVAAAVVLWRRQGWARTSSPLLVLAAAVGKLFPVVGLVAYVFARERRAAVVAVASGFVFLGYVALTLSDVRAIGQVAPQGQHFAYGARILVAQLARAVDARTWEALGAVRQVVAIAPLAAAAAAAWWWRSSTLLQALTPTRESGPDDWRRLAFHVGALVYVGTFATANNWDYRLVFLLFCLPQLLVWAEGRASPIRLAGLIGTGTVLVQLWAGGIAGYRTLADEVWSWLLAILLTILLVPGAQAAWRDRGVLLGTRAPLR